LLLLRTFAKWNESAQPFVAQIESAPDKQTNIDGKERMAEPGIADADMARNRPAQISREKNGTENRCARDRIKRDTGQQKNADAGGEPNRISQLSECLYRRRRQRLNQFESRIYKQEQYD